MNRLSVEIDSRISLGLEMVRRSNDILFRIENPNLNFIGDAYIFRFEHLWRTSSIQVEVNRSVTPINVRSRFQELDQQFFELCDRLRPIYSEVDQLLERDSVFGSIRV